MTELRWLVYSYESASKKYKTTSVRTQTTVVPDYRSTPQDVPHLMNEEAATQFLQKAQDRLDSEDFAAALKFAEKSKSMNSSESHQESVAALLKQVQKDKASSEIVAKILDAQDLFAVFDFTWGNFDVTLLKKAYLRLAAKVHPGLQPNLQVSPCCTPFYA